MSSTNDHFDSSTNEPPNVADVFLNEASHSDGLTNRPKNDALRFFRDASLSNASANGLVNEHP